MLTFILSLTIPLLIIVYLFKDKLLGGGGDGSIDKTNNNNTTITSDDQSFNNTTTLTSGKKKASSNTQHHTTTTNNEKIQDSNLIVEASTLKKKVQYQITNDDVLDLSVSRNYTAILKKSEKTIRIYKNELLVKDNKKFYDIEIGNVNDYGTSIALTEEGDLLAVSIDYDNFIKIFKLNINNTNNTNNSIIIDKPIQLPSEKKMIKSMKFSSNGKYLFAQLEGCDDISIYNLNNYQVEKIKTGQLENYMFSLTESFLCIAGFASIIKIYKILNDSNSNSNTSNEKKKKDHHHINHISKGNTSNCIKYRELSGCKSSVIQVDNYKNLILATTLKDEIIRLFDIDENEHYILSELNINQLTNNNNISNFKQVFICNENIYCGIGLNNEIVFFERSEKSFKLIHLIKHTCLQNTNILKACLNPKRKVLITCSSDGYLRMWKVPLN
ncbi:predicted protein [Naegleria gruberi]|uniref:Predicted protein n=1 Tax=Naegleria gruberi TaxID=5762 RepID=D2V448_NAEGR|nr:uncharacterized protein NAEGRDRAFT_63596 [Naegleria gruberi]EFC48318.1 predicted protein [Naegleria gruberi]|eukprot:XP_002681062.1 predicted protein [Naegleria gruberi strain NEG-M]